MISVKLSIFFCILFAGIFIRIFAEIPESVGQIRIRDASPFLTGTTVNTVASTSRSTTYSVLWSPEDLVPTTENAFIGIRSLNIVSQVVDFTVEWASSSVPTTETASVIYKITAGPNCNIQLLEHFVLMTADHASFASTFSTTTDAELTYTIPYTPEFPDLFTTGATAFVSFPRVKFAQTSVTYKFDYEIIQITSSSVKLKIRKYGNTVLEALQGQILVISSDATSSLGFKSTTITTPAFAAGTVGNFVTGTLTSTAGYYGAPEMMFTLKKWNFENLMSFRTEGEISIDSTNFKPTLAVTQVGTSLIQGLEYFILTFCKKGNECKRPGFQPSVIAGESKIQIFTGMSPGTATAAERAINFNIAFSRFLPSTPTNFAVGIQAGDTSSGFCARVLSITTSSIQIEVRAFANLAISKLKVSYIASLWDGFQIIPVDFADSGQLAATTTASGTRTFTQDVYYVTSANIGSSPVAYTIFSEVDVATPGSAYSMDSSQTGQQTSVQPFSVQMQQTVTDTLAYNKLKGFIIVTDATFITANKIGYLAPIVTPNPGTGFYSNRLTLSNSYYPSAPIVFTFMRTFPLTCGALKIGANVRSDDYYIYLLNCQTRWYWMYDWTCGATPASIWSTFSFPSYVSSSFDFNFIQGFGKICIDAVFTGSEEYAVVVTDDADWNGVFSFYREVQTMPRITQSFLPPVTTSGTLKGMRVLVPTIGASGFYHYNIIQTITSSAWYMAGLTSDYMDGFHDASSTEVPETAIGTFGYSGADLSQSIDKYTTLVATQFMAHDQAADFSCTVRVTFSGVIRSLYVDSKFILAGSSVDPTASITFDSEVTADFIANSGTNKKTVTVTIFGYYLKVTLLEFVDCIDGSSASVTPTFTAHIPAGTNTGSKTFYSTTSSVTCGSGCKSCKDSSICYECLDSHFLLGSTCVSNCNDITYFVAAKNKYCRSQFANLGLKMSPTSYSGGSISVDIQVNPFGYSYGALTMVYPKAITTANYPLIVNDDTKPLALVEGPSDGTITSLGLEQVFSISKSINVENIASALNPTVQLITYTIYQDYFLFFTVLSTSPPFIGFRQITAYGTAVTSVAVGDIYQVHVIVDASSGGDLSIEFKGQLEVILNQVTVIFSATFATQQLYTLERLLPTGVSYLTFRGTGTDYFDFSVSGSGIKIYAPISFLYDETVTIPVSSFTPITNCYNGDGSTCRSCLASYYLDLDNSQCLSNCTEIEIDLVNIDEERICKLLPPPPPETPPEPEIPPIPESIKVVQKVYQARQVSNEVFSVVSSIGFQGMHSIRSQTLQGALGYFLFINIKFPLNYIQYTANNKDSGASSDNTPVEENDTDEQSNIDAYIEDQDIGANIGQTLIYLAVCVVIIPVFEGIVWLFMKLKPPRSEASQDKWYYKVLKKGSVSLRWSFLMNQFISKYQDVTFFVFLGVYNAGRGEDTSHGNTAACIIGFILVVFILVGLLYLLRSISKEFKNYKEEEIEDEKFKENDYLSRTIILFKDLKKDKLVSLLYTFFAILRIFGFCFSIIFIGNVVGIQLAFLNISSLWIIFYLLFFNPFEEAKDFRLTLAYEIDFYVGVLAATLLQIYISAGGDDNSTKSGFGWAIIVADISMTVLDYISFGLEIREYVEIAYAALKTAFQKIKNRKRRPVSPEVEEGDSPTKMRDSDLKTDDASPEKKFFRFEHRDSAPSTAELMFVSNVQDPKKSSWKDRLRQSPLALEEQVFSVIEPKEENDNLMSFSEVKSPLNGNSNGENVSSLSPMNRTRRSKLTVMKTRKSHLSISSDKEIAEIRLSEEV